MTDPTQELVARLASRLEPVRRLPRLRVVGGATALFSLAIAAGATVLRARSGVPPLIEMSPPRAAITIARMQSWPVTPRSVCVDSEGHAGRALLCGTICPRRSLRRAPTAREYRGPACPSRPGLLTVWRLPSVTARAPARVRLRPA